MVTPVVHDEARAGLPRHGSTPSLDDVSSLDAYSGTTDANGTWTTTLHAGEVASAVEYTPSAANLEGSPFTGTPVTDHRRPHHYYSS
jgi:hypothetical protein